MKNIKEILENYDEYRTILEDRFGVRLCNNFLTREEAIQIGFKPLEGIEWETPKEFNRENVITQLKKDVAFGYEKAMDERGISASLMYNVVKSWLKVLEDNRTYPEYDDYGKEFFKEVANVYNYKL